MFNSVALGVVIGLIFIYLLYSLLITIVQEIIATMLAFRAKILAKAIVRMLDDNDTETSFIKSRLSGFYNLIFRTDQLKNKKFAKAFYSHPLIKYLAEDKYHSKPSYINAKNFSKVIVDLLHGIEPDLAGINILRIKDSLISGELKYTGAGTNRPDENETGLSRVFSGTETQQFLQSLLAESQGDIEKFRLLLEKWFDDTMQRATGWYKKYTQVVLMVIGLIIAIGFNVDTISIAKKLARDPALREQMVQSATAFIDKNQQLQTAPPADTAAKQLSENLMAKSNELLNRADSLMNDDIKNANGLLGLGWGGGFMCFKENGIAWTAWFGWLITALALSLGAPFWFDLLNKLIKLRGAGANASAQANAANADATAAAPAVIINNNSNAGEGAVG